MVSAGPPCQSAIASPLLSVRGVCLRRPVLWSSGTSPRPRRPPSNPAGALVRMGEAAGGYVPQHLTCWGTTPARPQARYLKDRLVSDLVRVNHREVVHVSS